MSSAADPPATTEPSPSPSPQPTTQPPASSAEPTTEPPASSAAPTTRQSSAAPQSSAPASSRAPQSSDAPASSSAEASSTSAAPSDSSAPASSQQASTSDAASSAPASSAAQSQASQAVQSSVVPTLTSAVDITTTDPEGHTVTTRPSVITQMSTGTDANGHAYTITQIVQNPGGANDSSGSQTGSTGFFDNTGAVAGTFVVVGLAATAGFLAFVFFMLRRRRRQRLDRDVAAAAAAAAAAAHHSRRDMDDYEDEKISPANSFGGGYNADIHGAPQPTMAQFDYEDPAGGYDHYAANLPSAQDRMSTATAPGMAGFGAQAAQATYGGQNMYHQDEYENLADHPQQHSYPPQSQGGYNAITRHSGGAGAPGGGFFFDPKDAGQFYNDEDAYDYNEEPDSTQPLRPANHRRPDSAGSVVRDVNVTERGLKVTNV